MSSSEKIKININNENPCYKPSKTSKLPGLKKTKKIKLMSVSLGDHIFVLSKPEKL